MCMNMDWNIRILLPDRSDKHCRGFWLQYTRHVLDTDDVSANAHYLFDQAHVVFQIVFLLGIEHVAAVADGGLHHASSFLYGLDAYLQLIDVVKSIEDSENVNTVSLRLLAEMIDCIVWQR